MNKIKRTFSIIVAFVSLAVLTSYLFYAETEEKEPQNPNISVILYEGTDDQWVWLKSGIQQACGELGVNNPVIKLADAADPGKQIELIEQELDDDTQGMLIAANNKNDKLQECLKTVNDHIPIVLLEPLSTADDLPCVALDDIEMSQKLAGGRISFADNVIVIKQDGQRENIRRRYNAFVTQIKANGKKVTVWEYKGANLTKYLVSKLKALDKSPRASIVAFDPVATEALIDAALQAEAKPRIYGIGFSEKILYYIDRQLVEEICYGNMYNIGFNAMLRLAQAMKIRTDLPPANTESMLVNKSNLYNESLTHNIYMR